MWSPTLQPGSAPIYQRLIEALAADIAAGVLAPGDRLPPHRDLAFTLGVGLGTVTRAYAEAEQRGLLAGHVGRGSFVADPAARSARPPAPGPLDLARSVPPLAPARTAIAAAMARAARRPDLAERLGYAPNGGFPEDRAAGAAWLKRIHNWEDLEPDRLICCSGAQQAVAVALGIACRPGAAVIAEAATFAGIKSLAGVMNYRLIPAPMDRQGLKPEGLERAARDSGARVAYVLPSQNPTARLMGEARRRDLVEIARRLDLTLVEDDLYGAYGSGLGLPRLTPLAALAPERVLFVSALSKSLAPGLRIGWLALPEGADWRGRALAALHGLALGGPTLGGLIANDWIADGTAEALLLANRAELARRAARAIAVLGDAVEPPGLAASPHVWLPLEPLAAEQAASRALRAGVELTPADGPILAGGGLSGLRLCLGGPEDLAALDQGLAIIKTALDPAGPDNRTLI